MIKLALAIGFLAVFGLVAYVIVVLLVSSFNKKDNNQSNNSNEKQTQTNKHNE